MKKIVVRKEIVIDRPVEVVRAQFSDMRHHEAHQVHSTLQVSNVRARSDGGCMFTGRRSVMGMTQEDDIEVAWLQDGRLTLRSVRGSNQGLLITQSFTAEADERTRVSTVVDMPLPGIARWFAPLVRLGVERDLALAMREDQHDLERGAYAQRPATA